MIHQISKFGISAFTVLFIGLRDFLADPEKGCRFHIPYVFVPCISMFTGIRSLFYYVLRVYHLRNLKLVWMINVHHSLTSMKPLRSYHTYHILNITILCDSRKRRGREGGRSPLGSEFKLVHNGKEHSRSIILLSIVAGGI